MREAICRPVHAANDAAQFELAFIARCQLLEKLHHPILIKATVLKIDVDIRAQVDLLPFWRGGGIYPRWGEPLHMFTLPVSIYHVNCLVATSKPILDEWQQHPIFLVLVVEQGTHMPYFFEFRTS